MGEPPSAGAVHVIVASASPATADAEVGASGTVAVALGVTAGEGSDCADVPVVLVALTVNVYVVPLVSPVIVQVVVVSSGVVQVLLSSPTATAVKEMMGEAGFPWEQPN